MTLINTVLIIIYCTYTVQGVILKTANKSNLDIKENNLWTMLN